MRPGPPAALHAPQLVDLGASASIGTEHGRERTTRQRDRADSVCCPFLRCWCKTLITKSIVAVHRSLHAAHYHLRKVLTKLGIGSRTQIDRVLPY
jgi:hypothetical protein